MSFNCPNCQGRKTLLIANRIELAPDARSDEISLQVLRCMNCGYEGLGVYEESFRGVLDSESVDHYGYDVNPDVVRNVDSLIKKCSKPKDSRCKCNSHQILNKRDQNGRWIRPGFERGQETFRIMM
jgi:hypothetical protein